MIAVDIGNTTIGIAVMAKGKIKKIYRLETHLAEKVLSSKLITLFKRIGQTKDVVICSVVPKKLRIVGSAVAKALGRKAIIIGKNIKVPIKNRYQNPRQVGQDRLVGAYAALRCYGAPAVIIDFGTAITFDVVSKRGEYLGGIIVPGIRLSAESLFNKTALLPKIGIKRPVSLIGRDTEGSILSGLFYGYGALSTGLINRIARMFKGKVKVIITGGHIPLVKDYIQHKIDAADPDLVFKGIDLVFRNK